MSSGHYFSIIVTDIIYPFLDLPANSGVSSGIHYFSIIFTLFIELITISPKMFIITNVKKINKYCEIYRR